MGGTKFQKLEIHVSRPQHFLYLWTGAKAFQRLKRNHEKDPTTSYHEMPMMQACNEQASIEQDVSQTHFQRTICSFFAYF